MSQLEQAPAFRRGEHVTTFIAIAEETALREALAQSASGQVRYVYRDRLGTFEVRTSRFSGGDLVAVARGGTLQFPPAGRLEWCRYVMDLSDALAWPCVGEA
jgi:hypothetical protein